MASAADLIAHLAGQPSNLHTTPTPTLPGTASSSSPISLASLFSTTTGTPVPGTHLIRPTRRRPYTLALVYGRTGSGKTELITGHKDWQSNQLLGGFPGPLVYCDFDNRAFDAVTSANECGKDITYLASALPAEVRDLSDEQAKELGVYCLTRVKETIAWAVEQGKQSRSQVNAVVLDGVRILGDIIKLSVRGRIDRPKPKKGDPFPAHLDALINQQLWYFPNKARENGVNLIMIAQATEIYEGRERTGKFTYDCDKIFGEAADWIAEVQISSVEEKLAKMAEESGGKLTASQILEAQRARPSITLRVAKPLMLEGTTYTEGDYGSESPFGYACSRLITHSKIEDWR